MSVTRRSFLRTGTASLAGVSVAPGALAMSQIPSEPELPAAGFFNYGVASGDPTTDSVLLWSHFSPVSPMDVDVIWQLATDDGFSDIVASGVERTGAYRDYTVKVDVTGLSSGTSYFYRFLAMGETSPVGRTRTADAGSPDSARFAVVSCSSYPHGYFNVYRLLAERSDLNAVIHLGDYMYEYGQDEYGEDSLRSERALAPAHETVSLSDYRRRHALYKLDPDLAAVHQQHPFICVWDDHEFTDNAWRDGASNHDDTEGDWSARKAAAKQAYFEWMPVRENRSGSIYRRIQYGDLLDLLMLDTRVEGRDEQPSGSGKQQVAMDENRSLLGFEQEAWLHDQLVSSSAQWKILGQQVMMAQRYYLNLENLLGSGAAASFWLDSWDGYAATRNRLLEVVRSQNVKNMVVLTGDLHASFAADISDDPYSWSNYNRYTGEGSLAVEFVTPSVTSPGFPKVIANSAENTIMAGSPHIKYAEVQTHGFILLTVDRFKVQSDWYYVPTVTERSKAVECGISYACEDGQGRLKRVYQPA